MGSSDSNQWMKRRTSIYEFQAISLTRKARKGRASEDKMKTQVLTGMTKLAGHFMPMKAGEGVRLIGRTTSQILI